MGAAAPHLSIRADRPIFGSAPRLAEDDLPAPAYVGVALMREAPSFPRSWALSFLALPRRRDRLLSRESERSRNIPEGWRPRRPGSHVNLDRDLEHQFGAAQDQPGRPLSRPLPAGHPMPAGD